MASTTWLADYSIFVIPKQCGKEQQATFFLSNWKTISWNLNDSLTNTILEWFNGIFVKTNDLSQTTLWKNAKFTLTKKKKKIRQMNYLVILLVKITFTTVLPNR